MKSKNISTRVTEEECRQLYDYAERCGVMPSEIVREALRNRMKELVKSGGLAKIRPGLIEETEKNANDYIQVDDNHVWVACKCGRRWRLGSKNVNINIRRHLRGEHNFKKKDMMSLYEK